MILFVSGRCDIPAFYSEWFFNRLKEQFVDVRNPFNDHQISRIPLTKENIDILLFCTKNPIPMLPHLDKIAFPYIFHITLTPYKQDIEKNVPDKTKIMDAIIELSARIGRNRIVVRYDPILLNETYTIAYHIKAFEKLCQRLEGHVSKIIISFVDMYKNTKANMKKMNMKELTHEDKIKLAKGIGKCAMQYSIQVQTCAEDIDLRDYQIQQGNCIDRLEIESYLGYALRVKGKGVRKECTCLPTVDIGDYNCCSHECLYCYANYDAIQIYKRMKTHNSKSSVLLGQIENDDHIVIREEKKLQQLQFRLL